MKNIIDVGQGDSALVECDGRYMLIDGGNEAAGEKVCNVLKEKEIRKLDILAISHLHEDHYGGLRNALTYASSIKLTISNSKYSDNKSFLKFERELRRNGSKITVPPLGKKYKLGSAMVEVVDVSAEKNNDSLVLLITYGSTRFLFTGDIERQGQLRVVNALKKNDQDFTHSLIKMPHHGAYNDKHGFNNNALQPLFWKYYPDYIVISVGKGNQYDHPHQDALDIVKNLIVDSRELKWDNHVFRTDLNGDITVKSNGKELTVKTSK